MRMSPKLVQERSDAGSVFDSTFATDNSAADQTSTRANRQSDFPTSGQEFKASSDTSDGVSTSQPFPAKADVNSAGGAAASAKNDFDTSSSSFPTQADSANLFEESSQTSADPAADKSADLVGVDGKSMSGSANQTTETSAPLRPPVPGDKPFDFSEIEFQWWWLCGLIIPLLLFRYVMGTSSSYELDKYKYRGPAVQDPDDPNVRGRFKKRGSSNEVQPGSDSTIATELPRLSADPDDDLSFLDEAEDEIVLESPTIVSDNSEFEQVASDLSADPDDESTHVSDAQSSVVDSEQDHLTPEASSSPSAESQSMSDPTDSDVDFDFFMDDDETQTIQTDASEIAEAPISAGSAGEDVVDATEDAGFALGNPEPNAHAPEDSDDELDFLGDDSDDGFQLDDDDEVPAIAALRDEEAKGDEKANADLAAEVATDASSVDEEAEEQSLAPAVAAAASVAAVAATTKGGSWMSRIFGSRKAKQPAVEEALEDNAIAATAIREEQDDDFDLEDLNEVDDQPVNLVEDEVIVVPAGSSGDESGEFSFSDSSDSFSLEDDDSSDGLFDDDSDAGYQFDMDEADAKPAASASAVSSAVDDDDEDNLFDESEPLASVERDPLDEPAVAATESVASFDFDEDGSAESIELPDDKSVAMSEEGGEEFAVVSEMPSNEELPLMEDHLLDDVVDSEDLSSEIDLAEPVAEAADLTDSIKLADDQPLATAEEADEEFAVVGQVPSSEELPLMEDQILDEIVDSEIAISENDATEPADSMESTSPAEEQSRVTPEAADEKFAPVGQVPSSEAFATVGRSAARRNS